MFHCLFTARFRREGGIEADRGAPAKSAVRDGKLKRRAVGWGYVIGLIGEFAPTRKHLLLAPLADSSMISMLRAPAAHPIAAQSPTLLVFASV